MREEASDALTKEGNVKFPIRLTFSVSVCGSATHNFLCPHSEIWCFSEKFSVLISKTKNVAIQLLYCQDASAHVSQFAASNQLTR